MTSKCYAKRVLLANVRNAKFGDRQTDTPQALPITTSNAN